MNTKISASNSEGIYVNRSFVLPKNKVSRFFHEKKLHVPNALKGKYLVCEGGGIRALVELGAYLKVFDEAHYFPWKGVVGTSASGLILSAYLSGHIKEFARVLSWVVRVVDPSARNILRLLFDIELAGRGRHPSNPILPVGKIVDRVFDEKMINMSLIKKNPVDLYLTLTTEETGVGKFVDVKQFAKTHTQEEIRTLYKASAHYPVLSSGTYLVDGDSHLDGGASYPFPHHIFTQGKGQKVWSKILFVFTDEEDYVRKPMDTLAKRLLRKAYGVKSRIVNTIEHLHHPYNFTFEDLRSKLHAGQTSGIFPPPDFPVELCTVDVLKISKGYRMARVRALSYLALIGYPLSKAHRLELSNTFL